MFSAVEVFSLEGDILITMGNVQYCGRYHDKCGGSEHPQHMYHGISDLVLSIKNVKRLNIPMVLMISTHMYHDILHGTEHPPW